MQTSNRNILNNMALDQKLREEGYVVVSFLNSDEIERLKDVFSEINAHDINQFYATAHSADTDFRRKMSEAVRNTFARAIDGYFDECNALGGSFVVKSAQGKAVLQPHQDWNIVDEQQYRSFNIWVPLVDLNTENGTILVMPKSHRWIEGYRHSSIPCMYAQVHDILLEHMEPLYLKAGEALIYDHSLLHASESNRSDETRIACACGIIPSEAEMRFYWNNNGTIEEFESSPAFFMTKNVFTGPHDLVKIRSIECKQEQISVDEFYKISGIEKPLVVEIPAEINPQASVPPEKKESKSFWEVYTIGNILREIKFRISGN